MLPDDDLYAEVDLKRVEAAMVEAEVRHIQRRAPGDLHATGCSCGAQYESDDPFAESHAHLRRVAAVAVISALSGVCDTCAGRGLWRKLGGTFTCPDCGGLGESVFPLPPMHYRDMKGVVWVVTKQIGSERALIEKRARD